MTKDIFLKRIKGGIFKLLPLWEEEQAGVDVHLDVYIEDLIDELMSASEIFPELKIEPNYMHIMLTLTRMSTAKDELSFSSWRRKTFKMLSMIDQMRGGKGYVREL